MIAVRVALAWLLVLLLATSAADAQKRDRRGRARQPSSENPFDPSTFFEQFFGEDTAQDDARLEGIEVSLAEERKLGDQAAAAYIAELRRRRVRVLSEGRDVGYLEALVEDLRPFMQHGERYPQIRVLLADSPETDARSFPGGTLIFFRGMLDFAESEAALVGVIGHELSHLDRGHQLLPLRRAKLAQQTFASGEAFSPERFLSDGAMLVRLWSRPFRPQDEAAADADGATWAFRAGYDPREMAALFRKLHQRDGQRPQQGSAFLRTHPYHLDRYDAVMALRDELSVAEPAAKLYVGRENLRRRVTRRAMRFEP